MSYGTFDDQMPFHRKWLGLSNDAYAIGMRALLWSRSPGAHARPGYVTQRELRALSGGITLKAFEDAIDELVDAGRPAHDRGILVPTDDGGFEFHDVGKYGGRLGPSEAPSEPPRATPPATPIGISRSERGRLGGLKSAESRRNANGTAQPPRSNLEANPRSNAEATPKQNPEAPQISLEATSEANQEPTTSASGEAGSKDLSGSAAPEANAPKQTLLLREQLPRNLAEANEIPICERALIAVQRHDLWPWILPEKWREVLEVVEEFARAAKQPRRAGPPNRDEGVLRILERFAEGNLPSAMKRVAREQPLTESFRRKKLGLAALFAPESFAIALSAAAQPEPTRETEGATRERLRKGPRQPNTLDHLDDQAHAAAIGARLE